jgi:hypothetical protein
LRPACPTYFERFPTKEVVDGYYRLKEWYPANKYPRLNAQWDARIKLYEDAMRLL